MTAHPTPTDPASEAVSALREDAEETARSWLDAYRLPQSNGAHPMLPSLAREFVSFGMHARAPLLADIAALRAQEVDYGEYIIDLEHKIFHVEALSTTLAADLAVSRAEVARLRDALTEIAEHFKEHDEGPRHFGVRWAFHNVQCIARTALNPEGASDHDPA